MDNNIKKNDFIQLEYTGKIKDSNEIFDTNIEEQAKKINLNIQTKPLSICIGQGMILESIDEFLEGKELGTFTLDLTPEKAFGLRDKRLIKIMPLSVFQNQKVMPERGQVFSFDGMFGKISSISGGRVIVDFNNPIAGKEVVYELKLIKKLQNQEEKIKSLIKTFFKTDFSFKLNNNVIEIEVPKPLIKFIDMFKDKFKEILNLEIKGVELKEPVRDNKELKSN